MFTRDLRYKLSSEEKAALERLAALEGLSQAGMTRRLIRQAAAARGIWPPVGVPVAGSVMDQRTLGGNTE